MIFDNLTNDQMDALREAGRLDELKWALPAAVDALAREVGIDGLSLNMMHFHAQMILSIVDDWKEMTLPKSKERNAT